MFQSTIIKMLTRSLITFTKTNICINVTEHYTDTHFIIFLDHYNDTFVFFFFFKYSQDIAQTPKFIVLKQHSKDSLLLSSNNVDKYQIYRLRHPFWARRNHGFSVNTHPFTYKCLQTYSSFVLHNRIGHYSQSLLLALDIYLWFIHPFLYRKCCQETLFTLLIRPWN